MSDIHTIPLGTLYTLHEPLGRGAMGEVFSGVHVATGLPVAIKVLTASAAREPLYAEAFREEVRAAASLDHPHIVTVYDYGRTTEETAERTAGRYPVGSPYLVMEVVHGGSLRELCGRLDFSQVARVLHALLDALGHAHARGLIHRDLKPQNVLVSKGSEGLTVKLVDFGLAHAMRPDAQNPFLDRLAGTPNYMAPEQVLVHWRDYGPATDLYALGCLTHMLVRAQPPFAGAGGSRDILNAHVHFPAPALVMPPGFGAPPGFAAWVARLLEKDPARRYACAADAAFALLRVQQGGLPLTADEAAPTRHELSMVSASPRPVAPRPQEDLPGPDTVAAVPIHLSEVRRALSWSAEELARALEMSAESSALAAAAVELPPVPADWRRHEPNPWNPLVGAGLGLYGLRAVPLVGRVEARDQLWQALHAVHADGRPRAVVLEGPPGHGKTRLAAWLAERAAEVGAAKVLRATHSPTGGPHDGLVPVFARLHGCQGLERPAALARLSRALLDLGEPDEERWHQLAEVLAPGDDEPAPPARRRSVLRTHLARLAHQRPVILWIDDAQWAGDAVNLVSALLREGGRGRLPVLAVLTTQAPLDLPHIEPDPKPPAVQRIRLDPLGPGQMPDLVQTLLGLDCELAADVEARAEGNPLFAVSLVGDWVERGDLVPTTTGFRLRAGARRRLPDSIHQLWIDRLLGLLGEHTPERRAVELGAILGAEVEADLWAAACNHAGVQPHEGLIERLLERGLARRPRRDAPDWAFAHGLLRESVLRAVEEAGRSIAHHAACAAALATRTGPGMAERRARHCLAAGDREGALTPLVDAAWERLGESDYARARSLLDEWQTQVATLGLDPADPRRGEGWLLTCRIARVTGELERGRRLARAAEEEGRRYGWTRVVARTLVDLAWDAHNEGDRAGAVARLAEGAELARALDDEGLRANCLRNQAVFLLESPDRARVAGLLDQALAIYRRRGNPSGAGLTLLNLAQLERRQSGEVVDVDAEGVSAPSPRIERLLDEAEAAFTAGDKRWGLAMVEAERGLLALLNGDTATAEAYLARAAARYRVVGGVNAPLVDLYRAELHLVGGRAAEARANFARLRAAFDTQKRHGRALHAALGELAAAAAEGDFSDFEAQAQQAHALLDGRAPPTRDGARLARRAAEAADAHGNPQAAQIARALTRRQAELLAGDLS